MKLSTWATQNGICYKTAWRWWHSGKLPCKAEQTETGTILVYPETPISETVAIYGRVSSSDQKADLERQMIRLRDYCAASGLRITKEAQEVGSGLNGSRQKLLKLLGDPTVTVIVVEHRDRFARFGFELVQAALQANGRRLLVINDTDSRHELVQDFIDVVTAMCARIYGKRSASNRAKRAVEAARND